jgi:hypothetical protein
MIVSTYTVITTSFILAILAKLSKSKKEQNPLTNEEGKMTKYNYCSLCGQ